MLDHLPQFNSGEGRTKELPGPMRAEGSNQYRLRRSVVLVGSLSIVKEFFDRPLPTSLRVGVAEFVFAGFTLVLPYLHDS
jgi:hypothetical protein